MASKFRVIQGCPAYADIAPYIAIVVNDARATVESIYRGDDAAAILHRHNKSTQRELYNLFLSGRGFPANRPGTSSHELRSDGRAFLEPAGGRLSWWQQGFDVDNTQTGAVIAAARRHGWDVYRPYPGGSEYHHLNFRRRPRPGPRTWARIVRLRLTLPKA